VSVYPGPNIIAHVRSSFDWWPWPDDQRFICPCASDSSDSSEEEEVKSTKQAFVPALDLTDVKKKGTPEDEVAKKEEKKGILGMAHTLARQAGKA